MANPSVLLLEKGLRIEEAAPRWRMVYRRHTKPEGQHNGREPHIDRHKYRSLQWNGTEPANTGERNSKRLRIYDRVRNTDWLQATLVERDEE